MLKLVLDGNTKLLFLIHDEQSQVLEFNSFANELVGAYDNVDFALGKVGDNLLHILGLASATQVINAHWEVLEALAKGVKMLECQHCGRYQHSGLLAIYRRLECGTNGDFGLAEAHITTHQAVHGFIALHVGLHCL